MSPRGNVASNMYFLRRRRGWTQSQLSDRLAADGCRLSAAVLSNMEKSKRGIYVEELVALAAVFDTTPTALISEPDEAASTRPVRHGRAGMPMAELAQWAERFVEALETDPQRPYDVLADRYGGWSDGGLRSVVRRAREIGILTQVRRRQTGGELTDKARSILEIIRRIDTELQLLEASQ